MLKEINLTKLIEQHCYITKDDQEDVHSSINSVKEAIKDACQQVLELAAETAKTKLNEVNPNADKAFYRTVVDKQSILDVINQVK